MLCTRGCHEHDAHESVLHVSLCVCAGHLYPMAMFSWPVMPPPKTVDKVNPTPSLQLLMLCVLGIRYAGLGVSVDSVVM